MEDTTPLPHDAHALAHWYRLQDGILYTEGGYSQQPAWYWDDMAFMSLLAEYEDLPYQVQYCNQQIQSISKQQGWNKS